MAQQITAVWVVCMRKLRNEPVLLANLIVAVAAILGLDLDGEEIAAAVGTLVAAAWAVRRRVSPV